MIGHVAPEAAVGGPLAVVQEGDIIAIDTPERKLNVELSDDEIASRLAAWSPPPPRYTSGVMGRYAALVSQANDGAILRIGFAR
jgi:dihydroxy-acid dehydratase